MSNVTLLSLYGLAAIVAGTVLNNDHLGIISVIFFCTAAILQEIKKLKK